MSAAGRPENAVIDRFRRARRDPELAVIEGFHALKHALRFDAPLLEIVTADPQELERLASTLAPDLNGHLLDLVSTIEPDAFEQLAARAPRTGVIAIAGRILTDSSALLSENLQAPIVLLEEPRDLNNVGACIRVAAAAQAAGVIVTGRHDPWHPDAIRGSAGLHYALPVVAMASVPNCDEHTPRSARPLIALDPEGDPLQPGSLPADAILAFGSERQGLSASLLEHADARLSIPMGAGVSSLNLATSVAAVLFSWRLCSGGS
jgi:TrmH family RNA methyltransferase